jgi:predicted nucleotidyltransferase
MLIKKFPEIEKAKIFGSRAIGNYKRGSDIDIAIIGNNITFGTVLRLKNYLEDSTLPYFVDILDYKSIKNQELKKHIDEKGIELYPPL